MNSNEKRAEKSVTLSEVKNRPEIREMILAANDYLKLRGYTEHGLRHVGYVCNTSANLLKQLGYSDREVEIAAITGWLHDIGNSVNRYNHGIIGATLAYPILVKMGMKHSEILTIITAIGNHEDEIGIPANVVGAALILADKSDAHRTRVRRGTYDPNDIHDRVNYSIQKNFLVVNKEKKTIKLVIYMTDDSSPMEYLEIYMSRMKLSEKAAQFLGCDFELCINDVIINNHKPSEAKLKLSGGEKEVSETY